MKKSLTLLFAVMLCASALAGCAGGGANVPATAAATQTTEPVAATPTPSPTPEPTSAPTPEPTPHGALPEEDYAYFGLVGFGQVKEGAAVIGKWTAPIRIEVKGTPNALDAQALSGLADALRGVAGMPEIEFVTQGGNACIAYVPKNGGKQIDPGYNGTDDAQFFLKWKDGAPALLNIVITNELISQDMRDAALASLLFRGLGLALDPQGAHADSVLNPAMSVKQPSDLDWLMLALLYSPQVKPGMAKDSAMPAVWAVKAPRADGVKSANSGAFRKSELLSYLNEVGFFYPSENSPNGIVSKWAGPISLQISGTPTGEQRELLESYVASLNKVIGFPGISVVPSGGNFTVNFAVRGTILKGYPKMSAAEACAFKPTRGKDGTITKCAISVDAGFKDAAQARSQLLRLLIWSLGVNFTSGTWPQSILNLGSNAQEWAKLDWQMLGLLYRSDIKPGAGRAAVMAMLEKSVK